MWESIKKGFNFIKNYYVIIASILMIVFMILFLQQCRSNKNYRAISNQNISALTDSLRYERNKNGDLVAVNTVYAATGDELKKLNSELYNELQKEIQQNYILYIKLKNSFNSSSTITITNTIKEYPNDVFSMLWDYKKDTIGFCQELSGDTRFKIDTTKDSTKKFKVTDYGTQIIKNSMTFDIFTGLRKNDETGKFEITARASNPDISINPIGTIDPDIIMNTQDNFIVSIGGGLGYGTSLDGKNGQFGWHIDLIHVGYRIFSW